MNCEVLVDSIRLDKAATCAFTIMRDFVWRDVLNQSREKIRNSVKRSAAAKEVGLAFVDKLVTREAATRSEDDSAKRTHKYLYEERLRGKLVSIFEDMFPFVWDCPWSATSFRTHAAEINYLLSPILGASKSRLLGRTPIAVVVEVFHAVHKKGANEISWWMKSENEKYLADASVLFMKGMQKDKDLLEQKENLVRALLSIIFTFFEQNAYLFVGKSKFVELSDLQLDMQNHFVKRVSRSGSSDTGFLYMEKSEAADLIRQLGCICTVLKAECILSMRLQLAIVQGCDEERARSVGCICCQDNKKSPLLFSLDSLWLEVARMVADIAEGWDHINSQCHQYCLLKYMRAMKNPKAGPGPVSISYRKFFMLALALDQDINAMGIDVSDLVAPIVARVSRDGTPITGRKRRAPVSKRDQKRAKRLQRLVEESDDDEFSSEDDGRMDITIDSDNEAGEAPAEDQEDGVATVSDAVREGDDDLEERGADRERGDDEEHEGSSGDDDDIVDEREGADGDESEDYGIDSGDESEEPGKSGKGKGRVRTGGGKKKMKGSSRQKVRSSKRTKIKKPTRSRSRSGNKE